MTEPVSAAEPSRLPTLTSLRWYAALIVFLFHFEQSSDLKLLRPITSGYVGVTFFFVLSGFVLAWGRRPDTPARRFWWNRFAASIPRTWPCWSSRPSCSPCCRRSPEARASARR